MRKLSGAEFPSRSAAMLVLFNYEYIDATFSGLTGSAGRADYINREAKVFAIVTSVSYA
jgi:hypothetical protein